MPEITLSRHGRMVLVTLDNPPVNALSAAVRQGLWDLVPRLDADAGLDAVVLVCAGRTFVAGADVAEFDRPPAEPHLPDLIARIEGARLPWIAALHGTALGGGFELALGCRLRVALPDAAVGLPEVTLGLVPGASGTVRTPRLAGAAAALEMVLSGRKVPAPEALALGLIDHIVMPPLGASALAFAEERLARPLPPPVSARPVTAPPAAFWDEEAAALTRRTRGEVAPGLALACLRRACEAPFAEALAFERQTFLALRGSDQAKALRHVAFAERAALRPAALRDAAPLPLGQTGVVGGGTMGAGIAAALAGAGLPVTLIERDAAALDRGLAAVAAVFTAAAARGRLTPDAAARNTARVTGSTDFAALATADLVIEAVFEDLAVKRAVFAELGRSCRPGAVLATNTSYLDPRALLPGLPGPGRFLGLHFFSPAQVMRLLEIVPLPETDAATRATAFDLARRLGKIPVEAGLCEGFIGNRILKRYRAAAETLLGKACGPAEIDAAMRGYGFAMGPFEAQDLGGLDIAFLQREAARAAGQAVPETLADNLVRAGRKGQKTGGGWYDYTPGDRRPQPSAAVAYLRSGRGAGTREAGHIAAVLVEAMADEGAALLAEGMAASAEAIDLVEIHGYGFPRWRGGPMFATGRAARQAAS